MCYCNKDEICLKKGLGNISPCYYSRYDFKFKSLFSHVFLNLFLDIPVAASFPHFYNSDPSLINEVEGLKPIKEKHESIIIIQPVKINLLFKSFKIHLKFYLRNLEFQ
jgi:scavenger receptor class B, member 1